MSERFVVLFLLHIICLWKYLSLLMKIMRSSLYCLTFEGWFDCRSLELFVLVSMKGFLQYCTRFISMNMLRWLDDEIYPNDWIPQVVIKEDIALEQKTKSIRCDPRMNILGSFIIPWWWAIGSISLHFEHSLGTSPLLLANGSFASISNLISCFY